MRMTPVSSTREQRCCDRESAGRSGNDLLAGKIPCDGQHRHDHHEAAKEHGDRKRVVVPVRICVQSGERRTVVSGRRCVGVENLAEAVRAVVCQAAEAEIWHQHGDGGKTENDERKDEQIQHGHLHVVGFDLLAEILRRSTDHKSGDEDRHHDKDEHAVQAGAHSAKDNFAEQDVRHRHHAAERHEAVVHAVDRAATRIRRDGGEERRVCDAEADLLCPPCCRRTAMSETC